ncbi:putative inner membrane transporter YedA [Bryobacterales bacterium F-183]|nr:putative inner membrane transporter YedA [Bryobacterales bacterium F-183]
MAAWIALLCVYFFWGTTYLGIRIVMETMPPVVLVAIRFTLSGLILLAVAAFRKDYIPSPRGGEFWRTSLYGLGTLAVANTCLAAAEQTVSAGMTSLLITTNPFWMIAIDALVPGGERFRPRVIWGMLIGLFGAGLLLMPTGGEHVEPVPIGGFLILQLGNFGWSLGSIYQRRQPSRAHPIVSGAIQQLTTGLLFWIPALVFYRDQIHVTWRSGLAIAYLVTFGSIVGYSAYLYALDKLPVALVATHTYVNPLVACGLGYLLLHEPFGWRETIAMVVIFFGVAVVRHMQKSYKPDTARR